ncbi:pepsin/retropepsin-like aspartic protease family protein [Tautonia plasticadhaerens]|uniref:Peptidase A2 domain-containing protein n=1 Tax=Tautonia plasticadhaerens TaxID=2527974 RepID=A0A518GUK4_9BACT|nr:hypothetical protein [Tautonia plasticadhaerens]QDV32267.1 hypothetical protein ElP_00900 [Tautonia plasticadhaerens]
MRFPYQGYPVRGPDGAHLTLLYRPVIPVRIIGPAGDALAYGLVDTGADDTLIPDRFLGPLGVRVASGGGATIGSVGGAVPVRYGTVDLELRRRGRSHCWSALVGFYAGNRVILGHTGFLEYVTASFNGQRRSLTLTPNGTAPPPTMSSP